MSVRGKKREAHVRFWIPSIGILTLITIAVSGSLWIPDSSPYAQEVCLPCSGAEPQTRFLKVEELSLGQTGVFSLDQEEFVLPWDAEVYSRKELERSETLEVSELYFPWGADTYGRDYLSRWVLGARVSLLAGAVSVLVSLLLGILIGSLAGYFGGRIDRVLQWLIQVVWSIPTLLLAIAVTLALGKGMFQVFLAIGLTMWVEVARVIRGKILEEKEKDYVVSLQTVGFSHRYIVLRHILPNVFRPVIVIAAANFSTAILLEAGLSFLGIGVSEPIPSWGKMIKNHYHYIMLDQWHLAVLPGLGIVFLVGCFMLLGNALKAEWNP